MVHVGTCSWTEKSLIAGREFYPGEIRTAEGRLKYYAAMFDTVEVDSSYYALPDRNNAFLWAQRTPNDFIFHIKAYGGLTGHGIDTRTLPREIFELFPKTDQALKRVYVREPFLLRVIADHFRRALSPLEATRKLGILVFQFPPWFHYSRAGLDRILMCRDLMHPLRVGVEFRHGSWLSVRNVKEVLTVLEKNRITYIAADEPQYGTLATVPFVPAATTEIAYFRLHGRNKENWLKKGIETSRRYDYLYSDDELNEFIPPIREAGNRGKQVYVMFNNCHGASAVKNAARMKGFLRGDRSG